MQVRSVTLMVTLQFYIIYKYIWMYPGTDSSRVGLRTFSAPGNTYNGAPVLYSILNILKDGGGLYEGSSSLFPKFLEKY
jgi:hypothetical protein